MDIHDNGSAPRRGDRIMTSKTVYYVLYARKVHRRDPKAMRRIQMHVMRAQDMPADLEERLIRSALRGHQSSQTFRLFWYPRTKRRVTFEQYIRQSRK
jgi:hypothetical protein